MEMETERVVNFLKHTFIAAIINTFILTMDHLTTYVKAAARSDELTNIIWKHVGVFQLIILVCWPRNLVFWFICFVFSRSRQLILVKKKRKEKGFKHSLTHLLSFKQQTDTNQD